jgi:hypothetical protein
MGQHTGVQAKQPARMAPELPMLVAVPPNAVDVGEREDILAAMASAVANGNPTSTADALRTLRLAYPHHPLALRLAALAIAMKRPLSGGPAVNPSGC